MRNTTVYHNIPRTFRRSSRKMFGKYGGNLQNIKKEMRSIYIPDGFDNALKDKCKYWLNTFDSSVFTEEELANLNVFLQVDQSGAEALIVAYDCEPLDYRELFIHNVKPHVYVALKLFKDIWKEKMREKGGIALDIEAISNTPICQLKLNPSWKELDALIKDSDNWSLNERYYYLAKQTVHSSNYGIEASTFRMNILEKSGGKIVISKEEGERFLMVIRSLFPEIPERNRRVRAQIDRDKLIFNMFGHPLIITDYNIMESKYKEYYAWGPQSTVGEITRTAVCDFQEYIEKEDKKWDFLQDNHDSMLTQGPLHDTELRAKMMQEFMGIEFISPIDGAKFRMKSEIQVGFNWGAYDKNNPEKNSLGLREFKYS